MRASLCAIGSPRGRPYFAGQPAVDALSILSSLPVQHCRAYSSQILAQLQLQLPMATSARPPLYRGQTMPTYLPTTTPATRNLSALEDAVAALQFPQGMFSAYALVAIITWPCRRAYRHFWTSAHYQIFAGSREAVRRVLSDQGSLTTLSTVPSTPVCTLASPHLRI